ncbi:hypothetical protein MITS9504_00588 [Synechococcus sp. MIT S9504]|nr:hypothetical protein MITS9504_00588 [Synechococcus sp. MIT S9504]
MLGKDKEKELYFIYQGLCSRRGFSILQYPDLSHKAASKNIKFVAMSGTIEHGHCLLVTLLQVVAMTAEQNCYPCS